MPSHVPRRRTSFKPRCEGTFRPPRFRPSGCIIQPGRPRGSPYAEPLGLQRKSVASPMGLAAKAWGRADLLSPFGHGAPRCEVKVPDSKGALGHGGGPATRSTLYPPHGIVTGIEWETSRTNPDPTTSKTATWTNASGKRRGPTHASFRKWPCLLAGIPWFRRRAEVECPWTGLPWAPASVFERVLKALPRLARGPSLGLSRAMNPPELGATARKVRDARAPVCIGCMGRAAG